MAETDLEQALEALITRVSEVTWESLNAQAQHAVQRLVLDSLAGAAAGVQAPGVREALRSLAGLSVPGGAAVPWTDLVLTPADAAMAFSFGIHGWEFDDTHDRALVHSASVAVAAAYGASQTAETSGERLLIGVVVGVEVLAKLALAVGAQPGIIRTAGLGPYAAAAATAATMGLTADQIRQSMAIAASSSMTLGSRQALEDDGSVKRLQPGFAARQGVTAAMMAAQGVTGAVRWLSGQYGLRPIMADPVAAAAILGGERWEIEELSLKPYPSCRFTHGSIAAAEEVRMRGGAPISSVRVHVPAGGTHARVARPWARRGDLIGDRQFSIPWLVSTVLTGDSIDLAVIQRDASQDTLVEKLAEHVEVIRDQAPDRSGLGPVILDATRADGTRERVVVDEVPGSAGNPMSDEAFTAKIRASLEFSGRSAEISADLFDMVGHLPQQQAGELFRMALN